MLDRRNPSKFQIFIDRIFILFAVFSNVTALLEQ